MTESKEGYRFIPLQFERFTPDQMLARARAFRAEIEARRSVRHFSDDPIPEGVLDECIAAASSAPSGANRQPWTFAVVTDAEMKRKIREAAEEEERELYEHRLTDEWREALAPLGTAWRKPYLEHVPALIVVFRHSHGVEEGKTKRNYYTQESVGIALGFLIATLHHAGLATLTHTPSPMGFLGELLGRPKNEKAYVLLPVGFPSDDCQVPDLPRKPLNEVRLHY